MAYRVEKSPLSAAAGHYRRGFTQRAGVSWPELHHGHQWRDSQLIYPGDDHCPVVDLSAPAIVGGAIRRRLGLVEWRAGDLVAGEPRYAHNTDAESWRHPGDAVDAPLVDLHH